MDHRAVYERRFSEAGILLTIISDWWLDPEYRSMWDYELGFTEVDQDLQVAYVTEFRRSARECSEMLNRVPIELPSGDVAFFDIERPDSFLGWTPEELVVLRALLPEDRGRRWVWDSPCFPSGSAPRAGAVDPPQGLLFVERPML